MKYKTLRNSENENFYNNINFNFNYIPAQTNILVLPLRLGR